MRSKDHLKRVDTALYVDEWKRLALAAKRSRRPQRDFVRSAILFYMDEIGA